MAYPDNRYPDDPDFPAGTNRQELDAPLLKVITAYLTDLVQHVNNVGLFASGNLSLLAGATITFEYPAGGAVITDNAGIIEIGDIHLASVDWAAFTTTADLSLRSASIDKIITNLDCETLAVPVRIACAEIGCDEWIVQQTAATNPSNNDEALIWLSNGSGSGDVGDLMLKIKFNDSVTTLTLIDFV